MPPPAEPIPPGRDSGRQRRQSTSPDSGRVRLPRTDLPRRYLKAGDLIICRTACEVTTVLGSCVAVTFFSAQLGLGAICHAMLPSPKHGADPPPGALRWKYVCYAIEELIECFRQPGVPPRAVEVKIFGGGHLLHRATEDAGGFCVGSANVALARTLLTQAGFTIVAGDVCGPHGRKIVFNTKTGSVHVKFLGSDAGVT